MDLCTLLLAFLVLLSTTVTAISKHQTLTLTLTPLQSPPPLDPDFTTWTADPQSISSPNLDLRFRLAHRNSLHPLTSPSSLLRLRLDRDAARASLLSRSARRRAGFNAPVTSGLDQGSGEYFTRIGVGTPPAYAFMVLDTGSDITWIQCSPCLRCYSQSDPFFVPSKSKSFSPVNCSSPLCRDLDVPACDARTNSCQYQVSYGDGSLTTGDLSLDTLTFSRGARVRHVALGCGRDNEGLFVAAAGLLALGHGPLSFPTQAGRLAFSYCLVDRTSAAYNSSRSSFIVFGASAVPKSRPVAFTPMLRNPKMGAFYYVSLWGVSVGGRRVGFSASVLRLDTATGRGGVIVDSGTSVTRLARPAYAAVRDAFVVGAKGLKRVEGGFALFDTCFDLAGMAAVKVPTVALHFRGGATVRLPAENYLIPVDTKGTFCFAFAGTDGAVSIIGNIQQQGLRVVFDSGRSLVGFAPRSC